MATISATKIAKAQINHVQDVLQNAKLELKDSIGMSDHSAVVYEEKKEIVLYISLEKERKKSLEMCEKLKGLNEEELYKATQSYWHEYVKKHRNFFIGDEKYSNKEMDIIERTILLYAILSNSATGAVLASPDVDENFTKCGRYGYCWPRDALFINQAMLLLGMDELVEKFYRIWVPKTQLENGLFEQRYYSNGELAPSWGIQIDETASVILGIYALLKKKNLLMTNNESKKEVSFYKEIVRKAADGLCSFVTEEGFSKPCYDLWEERQDSHLYSTASIYAALKKAKEILEPYEECAKIVLQIELTLPKMEEGIQKYFVEAQKVKRSVRDNMPDISNLSIAVPFALDFGVFGFQSEVVQNTVKELENVLKTPCGGFMRYAGDQYMGGNAWIISSLWLADYYIRQDKVEKAQKLFDWVTSHADDKGFLAEQIEKNTGKVAWITSLSWSHAFYVIVAKKLKEKRKR